MSNLFAYGLGIAVGTLIGSIVWGFAWARSGRMAAIADCYNAAIVRTLRAARRTPDWQPPPTSRFGTIDVEITRLGGGGGRAT